jgi:putative endonuclease
MPACFYILRLKSGALYPGATTNLDQRYADHQTGRACRTTRLDPPLAIVHVEEFATFSDARRREAQVKRRSRAMKEALVLGDPLGLHALASPTWPIRQCVKY